MARATNAAVEEVETTDVADVIATVYAKAAQGQQRGSVIFEGLVEDAEEFIANRFPRMHSEEAGPDFTVETNPAGHTVNLPKGYPDLSSVDAADETAEPNGGTPAA